MTTHKCGCKKWQCQVHFQMLENAEAQLKRLKFAEEVCKQTEGYAILCHMVGEHLPEEVETALVKWKEASK